MKTIHLRDFITTGKLGGVTVDSTKNEIIHLLGNNFSFSDLGETHAILFGWYEIFYWTETGKVLGIQNDHLTADCTNHDEMINFKNADWQLDTWFLKEFQNVTFGQIKQLLDNEGIAFKIQPTYKGCDENIIKCMNSGVSFDFCDRFTPVQLNDKGYYERLKEIKLENENDFVLNGIRLFK